MPRNAQDLALDDLPYSDNAGEPIVGSVVPGLDWNLKGPALVEVIDDDPGGLGRGTTGEGWDQVPLLVCLAEPDRPGGCADLAKTVVGRLQDDLGVRFHPKFSRTIASGHTAGFEALRAARDVFADGKVSTCLVCGVDSMVNATTLLWLDRNQRLKTIANRDGVIPGEAAAAVLLQCRPAPACATEIVGMGFAKEKAHIRSEEPLLGLGLTEATRAALAEANMGFHEIDLRLSDVTGELYGFKELPLVESRLMRVVRKVEQPLWHWVEAIGDSGAAAGLVQLILADEAYRKGYAPGERAVCWASAVPGDRAAVILKRVSC